MNEKFLIRPKPYFDESFLGYISRLAECNSYPSPQDLMNLITKRIQNGFGWKLILDNSYETASKIADLTGNDVSIFLPRIQSVANKNYRVFFNSSVWTFAINSHYPKYCPMCLKEKNYYKAIWDLIVYTACPIHKCLLVTKCLHCGSYQTLFRTKFYECKCGFDFREAEITKVPENKVRIETHILKQLGLINIDSDYRKNILFDNFSFPECVNALCFFTRRISIIKGYSKSIKRLSSEGLMHSLVNDALKIFDDFPLNYNLWLEKTVRMISHPSLSRTKKNTILYFSCFSSKTSSSQNLTSYIYVFYEQHRTYFKKTLCCS